MFSKQPNVQGQGRNQTQGTPTQGLCSRSEEGLLGPPRCPDTPCLSRHCHRQGAAKKVLCVVKLDPGRTFEEPGQPEPEKRSKLWGPRGLAHACSGLSALGTGLAYHITEPGALGEQKWCLEASQERQASHVQPVTKAWGFVFSR